MDDQTRSTVRYEKPEIVNLGSMALMQGGGCTSFGSAAASCNSGGSAETSCIMGNVAGDFCIDGDTGSG